MRLASTQVVDVAAQYLSGRTRSEHDLLGDRDVPYEYYYGIQSLRAVENFGITGISLAHYPQLIVGLAMVKQAAARANADLGLLDTKIAAAIESRTPAGSDVQFIAEVFETILARPANEAEIRQCERFLNELAELSPDASDQRSRRRARLVHAILNHNDFITIR